MKHLFILNPIAGGGRRIGEVRAEILRVMEAQSDPWELYETIGPLDAIRKVKASAEVGEALRVYACGGDGTLSECVNGAVGQAHVAVTHFPAGTGNDFIKTFPMGKEHFFCLERLLDARVMPLDVIDVGGRYGINICSVGLDARVGGDVHKYSGWPLVRGKMAYVVSLVANIVKGVAEEFEVEVGGRTQKRKFTLICACNGRSYGGAFTPVPEAVPDDGMLDILLAEQVSRMRVVSLVQRYATGRYHEVPELFAYAKDRSITIRADREFVVNVDGEILRRREVTFTLLPGAVNFFLPREAGFTRTP
ncbi:MAG: hypothetical protein FWE12_01310 [Oscillospiraceae bacterium]|nr:hypothetical protein [Oscillospiraceae bacterium]